VDTSSPLSTQRYGYDPAGRLTSVFDHPTGDSCTRRDYGFAGTAGVNSNRTGFATTSFPADPDGGCTGTAGTATALRYDTADRLTTAGYNYDAFGRTTAVPASDAGGTAVSVGYYSTDMVASQTQGTRTRSWTLDPTGRLLSSTDSVSGGSVNHYRDGGDSPAWITTTDTTGASTGWSHHIVGLDGNLAAIHTYNRRPAQPASRCSWSTLMATSSPPLTTKPAHPPRPASSRAPSTAPRATRAAPRPATAGSAANNAPPTASPASPSWASASTTPLPADSSKSTPSPAAPRTTTTTSTRIQSTSLISLVTAPFVGSRSEQPVVSPASTPGELRGGAAGRCGRA
jgi:hypothetical protein